MYLNNDTLAKEIMTTDVTTLIGDSNMFKISYIFEEGAFHHLPVLNDENEPIGIVSSTDYRQLQNHFTRLDKARAEMKNRMFFRSLLASDIMTKNPVCIQTTDTIEKVIEIFLENKFHSVLVCDQSTFKGIITPLDILKRIQQTKLQSV